MANKNQKQKRKFVSAKPNGDGIISVNQKRNMAMRVYHNTDHNGKRMSITAHEPLNPGNWVTYKNHSYIEYRQPAA
jgi:hypothetical protein